ncbi:MAG TPA: mechanosensitive ion channel domain-containing protein [Chitinophagaceae bacterium]|nr:mechanosensitive ion channel domain-containing protein [Chitinophagaceae bacterium]
MAAFWNRIFLDNYVGDYLILAAVLLAVFLLRHLLSRLLVSLLHSTMKKWVPGIGLHQFLLLMRRPMELFFLVVVLTTARDHFRFPKKFNITLFHVPLSQILFWAIWVLFILSIFWILLRMVDFVSLVITERAHLVHASDSQIILFFRDFVKVIVGIIGIVVILRLLIGLDAVDKIIGALGIGAAALALAAKESIENLIASFIILFDKPFRVGDYVQVSTASGNVEKIGLRSTRIRTDQKTYLTVPNKQMVDNILDNQTLRTQRYAEVRVEIAPEARADTLQDLVRDITSLLEKEKDVEKGFTVNLTDISKNAFVLKLTYFTAIIDWKAYCALKEKIILAVIRMLENRQVRLASPVDISSLKNKET